MKVNMRCYACGCLLPTCLSVFYDQKVDRFYCYDCNESIEETMNPEPKTNNDGEVELLEEDFDEISDDLLYGFNPDEEDYNFPPENYDE